MKIIYGNGICYLDSIGAEIKDIVIYYEGNPYLIHKYKEIIKILEESIRIKSPKKKGLLLNGNNQIHIGFEEYLTDSKLFSYRGHFRITKAYFNTYAQYKGINLEYENNHLDFWDKSEGNWETDDSRNWEECGNTYKFGTGVKNSTKLFKTGMRNVISTSKATTISY